MSELRVVGVDPGATVGLALLSFVDDVVLSFYSMQADSVTAMAFLGGWLSSAIPTTIGCERYTIGRDTHKKSQQPRALEVIGVVRGLAVAHNASFRLTPPGPAKRLGNPARLRSLGMWKPGKDHANDGSSQCLHALAVDHPVTFTALLKSGTVRTSTETET